MNAKKFLEIHSVPSGDFGGDPTIIRIIGTLVTHGFDNTCMAFAKDDTLLCRVATASLLNDFFQNRHVYVVSPDGELILASIMPSNTQIFDHMFKPKGTT